MSGRAAALRPRFPAVSRVNLLQCLVVGYLVFCLLYLGSASAAFRPPMALRPTALDLALPFVAASVWVYLSQFLLLPWALISARDDAARSRTYYAMLLATVLSAAMFLLQPTYVPRQVIPEDGLEGLVWQGLYLLDSPYNAFPSLHVSLAVLAGVLLWKRPYRLVAVSWPACIAISTMTTRQHVAWDVAGGLLIAALAWYLTPKLIDYDRAFLTDHTTGC